MSKEENDNIVQALEHSGLCREFTQDEILSLIEEKDTDIKRYEKGSFIFEEDDTPDKLYVLIEGYVEVSKMTFSGKKILITTIENPGDMFAEVYMFMGKGKYDMSAQAVEESVVLSVSCDFFENISHNIKAGVSAKIRKKIALYLIENQTASGQITKNPSREELSDYLNVTRPSLSRELGNMEKEGIIKLDGRKIIIVSQDKLEEYL